MEKSLLPPEGENMFQNSKRQAAAAEAKGVKLLKLSIGQPSGPAILLAREAAARAVMSDKESMHEYQDNGSPGVPDFAKWFVKANVQRDLSSVNLEYLPIPGIKPMIDVVIKSLGAWSRHDEFVDVGTMTEPGYPTPRTQCEMNANIEQFELPLDPKNGFIFSPSELDSYLEGLIVHSPLGFGDMLMLNFPHNPTGIIATKEWMTEICRYCADRDIRIFNDAAYSILAHAPEATTLADVAIDFPELEWAEAFSASKAGNNTGWRVGAIVGSPAFVSDIKRIKGNTDSGFVAFSAAGILELYEMYSENIALYRRMYKARLCELVNILKDCHMELAVEPKAGFFALFKSPKHAFGVDITSADQFNEFMIAKTGIVGIPFDPYIRYAVCTADIAEKSDFIREAFTKANVFY